MSQPVQGFASIPRSMLHDPDVPRDAKLVYLVLSSHVGGNRMAWPSHKRMAELLGCGLSTVKRQLAWLRDHGYLQWEARAAEDGTQTTNSYVLLVGSAPSATPAKDGGSVGTGTGSQRTPTRSQRATPQVTQTYPPGHTDLRNESHMNESHMNEGSTAPRRGIDDMFEQFWKVYPRREGKAAAKVKFAAALRKVDLEVILAGAQRFRDDPNREPQFTPHPATWLHQGRWEDEPLPPRAQGGRPERMPTPRPAAGLTVQLPIESSGR